MNQNSHTDLVFDAVFKKIYGKPCWNVSLGHSSFLTLQFGRPHLEIREPIYAEKKRSLKVKSLLERRSVDILGEWRLWIYCCDWAVSSKGRPIGDSTTKLNRRRAADILKGQKLSRFSILPENLQTIFEFDLGATLRTEPCDEDSEQWMLYDPSHKVLSLRADGFYSYMSSDAPIAKQKWKPINPLRNGSENTAKKGL